MMIFDSLSAPGLTVISSQDEGFEEAAISRAFIQNLPRQRFPDAVLIAQSVVAVQAAVKFCSTHNLRICPRTGGHSWQPMWLQGKGSIILDVKSLDEVHFDEEEKRITTGPGAVDVNGKIPDDYFFPSGHCPMVPVGGFTLGGGYGIGFNKFGMASTLVRKVQVVLASGAIKTARIEDEDPVSKAIFDLVRGSYHRFPAVITELTFQAVPAPICVLSTMPRFKLDNWKKVIQIARDIQHRGDDDAADIETTIVFGYSPESVLESTGETKTVGLALTVWSAKDEKYARALLKKYTKNIDGAILPPPDSVEPVNPKTFCEAFRSLFPDNARYLCEGLVCDDRLFAMTDEQITDMVQPLADMWMSSAAPPSPSHSILPVIHQGMSRVNNGDLACGFTPSFVAMTYAIYQDETKDEVYANTLKTCMSGLERASVTYTEIPEGRIRTGKSAFTKEALESLERNAKLLDPNGLFSDKLRSKLDICKN
jgi:hypothetical protein